jgi:hypothetical protein
MTNRRTFLKGIGVAVAASGIIVGSGAFTQQSVARPAIVTVAAEPSLNLIPDPQSLSYDGAPVSVSQAGDGTLEIEVALKLRQRIDAPSLFAIENDGTETYDVRFDYTSYGSAVTGDESLDPFLSRAQINEAIQFRVGDEQNQTVVSPRDISGTGPSEITRFAPGDRIEVDLHTDTHAESFVSAVREQSNAQSTEYSLLETVAVRAIDPDE